MMGWPLLKNPITKKIPAPLLVLAFAIPAELLMDFQHTEPTYALVHIGNLLDNVKLNVDFGGVFQTGIFIKFVIMFALVGSLESLLTVKAIDMLDPYRRKSDSNKDLIAIGIGNVLAGILGGLPMISEVARSSANVSNGARTRWANFFHGLSMLVFVLLASHLIELIPNTALAAMLITVGIKLTHPKEFINTFRIGKEQLLIFVTTIIFTLSVDLLVGIAAGMFVKMVIHLLNGRSLGAMFRSDVTISFNDGDYLVEINKAAVFSNYLGIKDKLNSIPPGMSVMIDLKGTSLVDHSVMENLHHFQHDYEDGGGHCQLVGLENHEALSDHKFATRKKTKKNSLVDE
jgi:MFS superfamily sulfate permease-like transporter